MTSYKIWSADYVPQDKEPELLANGFRNEEWPAATPGKTYALAFDVDYIKLWEVDECDVMNNLSSLTKAKDRKDIIGLYVPYYCCQESRQKRALEELVALDDRPWIFRLTGIPPDGLRSSLFAPLFHALQNVQVLSLSGSYRRAYLALPKVLGQYRNLKELEFTRFKVDEETFTNLGQAIHPFNLPELRTISFHSCIISNFDKLLDALVSAVQVTTIRLHTCELGDKEIVALVNGLRSRHPSLVEVLDISCNKCYTGESVAAIASWIRDPTCRLRQLDLSAIWPYARETRVGHIRRVCLKPLMEAIGQNQSLEKMDLSYNRLDQDITHLARAIRTSSLRYIDLRDNDNRKGANVILRLMQTCPRLLSARISIWERNYAAIETLSVLKNCRYLLHYNFPHHIPTSLWPRILHSMREPTNLREKIISPDVAPSLVFQFLLEHSGELTSWSY